MKEKIQRFLIGLCVLILLPLTVFALGKIVIALGTPRWVVGLVEGFLIYWVPPQLVVRFLSNNQKNPKPRKEKGYWATMIDPGHGKLTMKAGVPNRLLPGPGYKFAGDDLENRASWIASERESGESSGGGRLSLPMRFFDSWLHVVTGYRFIGRTVIDTLSPTTELYLREITRESDEFKVTADRPKDITDHFILAQQERPFRFSEAETSRAGTITIAGQEVPADEGVPLEGKGSYLLRLVDMWKVFFEIGGDELSLSKKMAEEGAREIIQGGIADQFLSANGKSVLAEGLAAIDDDKDADGKSILPGSPTIDEGAGRVVHKGTRNLFGFAYTKFIITDLDPGGKFKDLFRKKAEERVTGLAALEAANREKEVATVQLETSRIRAQGTVALEAAELGVLQTSAFALRNGGPDGKGGLGSTDATALLVAREKRKGVEGFEGSTLVLSEGGQQTPILIPAERKAGG